MKIKDIVNRDIVTLTNCEHEPIHIPGSIQEHGFLLGIIPESYIIDFCSANVNDYIGIGHESVLGKTASEILGHENSEKLKSILAEETGVLPSVFSVNGVTFECTIHISSGTIIFEGELQIAARERLVDAYAQTTKFVSYMNSTNTLKELCEIVADGTREITGYDRVMIYRFDAEYNGEVYAESRRDDLEPFLGLHYPHTDIPVQARQLYMKNLLRLIPDINYRPVPLFTIDNSPGKNLDLSFSILRSTSPIHVEYLSNMGVGATLTISLIHRGRLWGLIACHHYSPKNLSPEVRLAAQLQGQFITSQIDVRLLNEEYEISRKTNIALEKLNAVNLPPVSESFKNIILNPELLKIGNASGVSILISGNVYKSSLTPSDESIKLLSSWLTDYSNDTAFHTDKIVNFVPEMNEVCDTVSGILYHSLGNGNSIIWYRPETLTEVHWAGDPNKAIIRDSTGLHPRNSFNLWKQVIKCRSNPWLQPELNSTANYAHALQRQISLMLLSQEEEKSRKLNEILKETNSELENINWISTHDLQEPLRKIQLLASRMLAKEGESLSETTLDSLKRMNDSANRMQRLLNDILKYTRIQHTDEAFEDVPLENVLGEVSDNLAEMIRESDASITFGPLPTIKGIPFLLKQLFSNVLLNSLKYAAPDRRPEITVKASTKNDPASDDKLYDIIEIADNGIGFQQQYADSIFNIFTRLHGNGEYKGSGVGLALCKKIMQTHGGSISASGVPDEGASIWLYFPIDENESDSL